jgi:hypothetical protein
MVHFKVDAESEIHSIFCGLPLSTQKEGVGEVGKRERVRNTCAATHDEGA